MLVVALGFAGCSEGRAEPGLAHDDGDARVAAEAPGAGQRVVFLGDSLTAGYGVDPGDAYPALIEGFIERRGWGFEVVNAGISGDTTASGRARIDWLLRAPIDVLVLALGGNDGLRGTPTDEMRRNLEAIVMDVRDASPGVVVVIAGMKAVPNMGSDFRESFEDVFPELADELDTAFVPFLLEGVGGVAALNQLDRIHPNEEGHAVIAEVVWGVLEDVLESRLDR